MQHYAAFRILRGLRSDLLIGLLMRGNEAKVLFDNRHRFTGLYIADDGEDHVGWDVVLVEKILCVSGGEGVQIRHPADCRAMILAGLECRSCELLEQTPNRIAINPHPAFFDHNIPFLVKLPHDGMQKTRGLEISPEFETILRE